MGTDLLPPEGEFLLTDVQRSLLPLPAGRRITQLRVYQLLPKSRTDNAADPRIGHPDQANARMLLGTVPVEDDGSAYFRARPTSRSIFRRWTQRAAPCRACDPWSTCSRASVAVASAATSRRARLLRRDGSWRRTVHRHPSNPARMAHDRSATRSSSSRCWTGIARAATTVPKGPTRVALVLTGELTESFSRSYENLKPYLCWPSPDTVTRPGELGADASPLSRLLASDKHSQYVQVPDQDLRTIYLWLDAHVPFFGTYEVEGLQAQRLGRPAPVPQLQ